MGKPAEHVNILHYVRVLRQMARDDKKQANATNLSWWKKHHAKERRRRLKEAWFWRNYERRLRGNESASTILLRSQLRESVLMEAAE